MGRTTTEEGPDWEDDDREDGPDEDSAEEEDDDREVGPDADSSAEEEEDDRDSEGNTLHLSKKRVGMGSFSDPYNALGLAHLLEHMLFLGSKEFPDENEVCTCYITNEPYNFFLVHMILIEA
ncbi:hypothetical protein ZIOFF_017156 [Zingiber officinale]|uniref:Peptidase M16 N-terminal domain-containing protein n=1 Tax=Zingiber officinale TaxID=94328 RepID=A0A8J5LL40_ZINOF|nr:hypothetical protein ZIOFF_017156 [Zingiber officinale]